MTIRSRALALGLTLACALGATPAHALDPALLISQYVHNVWRAPRDLPHDNVTSILQTRDGYLWIGTVEGLARFDGVRSVVFDKSNTPQIENNWIRALLEDREGRLWIGTFGGGLVCREKGRFVRYGAALGLPADVVYSLHEDPGGRLWVGTKGAGLLRFQGGRFVRETGTEALSGSSVRALASERDGTLWIATEAGLFRHSRGEATPVRTAGLTDDGIISLAASDEGLWIGTEKGLNRLFEGRVSSITTRQGLAHERVWSLAIDRDQSLWIGTDGGGLQRLHRGRLTTLRAAGGLTNDYVWAIHEDREGSLWIGTNGGGLNRLKNGRVVSLTTREGLPSDFAWSVLRTRDGSLFIGTEDGLVRVKEGRVTTYGVREGLARRARALVERRDGSLWVGGIGGLARWTEGLLRPVPLPGLERAIVSALAEDGEGTLWIGTMAGLKRLTKGRLESLPEAGGLGRDAVNSLVPARDGSLWVATSDGLHRRRQGQLVTYTRAQGLPSNYVSCVVEGEDGAIWATTRGGLVRVRDGRLTAVTSKQGLQDDALMSALLGGDGGVWMGTNRGLFRVALAEVAEVMEGRRDSVRSEAFGLDDGMRSVEVNHAGSAQWKDPDGRLWFTTRGGVVSIPPRRFEPNRLPPPVVIEEAFVDGRPLPSEGPWRLPAGTRRLDVHFTALSLRTPSIVRLQHRLDGFDPGWVDAGPDRTARYTNLPHGRYRFRVIAANDDGIWNLEGAAVDLEIEPRLHERAWFRALVAVFFALAGPLFYLARVRHLRRQQAALERLVAARTAEVEAANARLAQLVREDALTGIANRRRFDEALQEEWRRASRTGTPLALILVDVDSFKAYNDRLGHPAGDGCLIAVAHAVAEASHRAGELVARYGGEEFAVLLPGVSAESAQAMAENLRQRVSDLAIPHPDSRAAAVVTVSAGVAESAAEGLPVDLVNAADRALYGAKQAGRNRVLVARPAPRAEA